MDKQEFRKWVCAALCGEEDVKCVSEENMFSIKVSFKNGEVQYLSV